MSTCSERFVQLRDGLIIPAEPLLLVLDLQRSWKAHVLAILNYEAPTCA